MKILHYIGGLFLAVLMLMSFSAYAGGGTQNTEIAKATSAPATAPPGTTHVADATVQPTPRRATLSRANQAYAATYGGATALPAPLAALVITHRNRVEVPDPGWRSQLTAN